MVFSSLVFLLIFFPAVLLFNFLTRSIKVKNVSLCLFSLVFYAWGEPTYLFLMVGMVLMDYLLAMGMDHWTGQGIRRMFLLLALATNLGSIVFFKYGDFALVNLEVLLGTDLPSIGLSLPIGISFFTFQVLSYVIDVYRREVLAQKSLLKLTTYVSLFPQLVAGPIVRYQTVAQELDDRKETWQDFSQGLHRFVMGLGKKVIFANSMALIADTIYGESVLPGAGLLWLAALAYMLQIYFDFSGYSDMAIGMGRMFGFHFLENFNFPYAAHSITDFWRRWHISLSTWFRDYVYIPLGGNRVGPIRHIFNLLAVWLLTGLWHGAAWNYVLWGLFYFLLLTAEKRLGKGMDRVPMVLRRFFTLLIVYFGWILFRTEDLGRLSQILAGMFSFGGGESFFAYLSGHYDALQPLYLLLPACVACFPAARWAGVRLERYAWYAYARAVTDAALFALCLYLLLGATYNPFIYFRF